MKAKVVAQFIGKTEPNREKGKENFHYGIIATDSDITKELASDFTFIDFWCKEDYTIKPGQKALITLDIQGDFIKFLSLDKIL